VCIWACSPRTVICDAVLNSFLIAGFLGLVLAAMIHDARHFIIPNGISLAIAALFPLHAMLALELDQIISQTVTAAAVFALTFAMWHRGWLGGGDVKLIGACLLWIRSEQLLVFLIFLAVASLLVSIFLLAARKFSMANSNAKANMFKYCPFAVPIGAAVFACSL